MRSYYKGNSNHQKVYNSLMSLIPTTGSCQTLDIELFRLTVRLYHGFYDKLDAIESRIEEFRHTAELFDAQLSLSLGKDVLHDIIMGKLTVENLEALMDTVVAMTELSRSEFTGDLAKDWENVATELFNVLEVGDVTEQQKQAMIRFERCKKFHS